jgi:hypothetical protein
VDNIQTSTLSTSGLTATSPKGGQINCPCLPQAGLAGEGARRAGVEKIYKLKLNNVHLSVTFPNLTKISDFDILCTTFT